jgi:hypothetical protein
MSRFLSAVSLTVLLFIPGTLEAAKVRVWYHHTPAHFEKARLKKVVISNEGVLRLSRQLKPLTSLDATHVWDVVEDPAGNLFVATGDEGRIYKISPDGNVSVAYTAEDSQVLCLALSADGTLYAGTGPGGRVLRLKNGRGEALSRTPEAYIWCLAISPIDQTVYAGTGPKGRIYEITAEGKASLFYATKQEHILSLATGADGVLYAGVDKDGLVYRIDRQRKAFVLYSAPQAEVRSLLVVGDEVYAGTSSPTRRRGGLNGGSGSGRSSTSSTGSFSALSVSSGHDKESTASEDSVGAHSSSTSSESGEKAAAAAPPPQPTVGENSLYRILPDGTVREIFRERVLLLSLLRQDGRIFIGTGMQGQLFDVVESTKERSEIARLDHGQIHCLCRRHDGSIVVGAGDPGKLYVLQDHFAAKGTVTSEVLDARLISKWGALRWTADTPAGTAVTVAVRTGNTPEPTETWSDWSQEQSNPEQATIAAPAARFLQYRITLSSSDPAQSPAVHGVALRYMTTNQAPEVTQITVPDLDAANQDNAKKIRLKWTATDPNEDELTYNLYVRKEGWKNWVLLEENLEHTDYEWDSTTTPSGMYQVKVVASDRRDNPPEEALSGSRMSPAFAVAHTPPTVTLKTTGMDGDQAVIEAAASDPLVRLTAASFSVNGKKWVNIFPADGLFDSKTETFRFKTDALKPGTYVVVLRVRDAAGNTGAGDVVFTLNNKP